MQHCHKNTILVYLLSLFLSLVSFSTYANSTPSNAVTISLYIEGSAVSPNKTASFNNTNWVSSKKSNRFYDFVLETYLYIKNTKAKGYYTSYTFNYSAFEIFNFHSTVFSKDSKKQLYHKA